MPSRALTMDELQNISDDKVARRHDEEAKTMAVGVDYFRDGLNRRHQERQTRATTYQRIM